MRHDPLRRRLATVLAVLVATSGLALAAPGAATAAPPPLAAPGSEGGSKSLRTKLEDASKGFVEAKEKLAQSKKREAALTASLKQLDAELGPKKVALNDVVRQSYRTGRLGPMSALLSAGTPGGMLDRVSTLETVAIKQEHTIRDLTDTRTKQEQAKVAIGQEIGDQQKQVTVMAKRKKQAQDALAAVGAPAGGTGGFSGSSAEAGAVQRTANGGLPDEGCSVDDPTTNGCISPRTLHAMNEAKKDGFTHFVSCYRPEEDGGEHPRGKACDFAADEKGFGGVATGKSRSYGDSLATYFVNNADRLGVLYVIWFKQIWLPGSGWQAYTRGNGDPSSDHTNHVHLSMR
ncbi:coiled-coil domain-containing protein [Actinoplanes sp. NPDC051859]|uniref:coiled-coil domain-containing protein n=1 Tax=Actinoplanes sp. NPDC051859 TaxID=3363909 RepID=UPI0037B2F7A2